MARMDKKAFIARLESELNKSDDKQIKIERLEFFKNQLVTLFNNEISKIEAQIERLKNPKPRQKKVAD